MQYTFVKEFAKEKIFSHHKRDYKLARKITHLTLAAEQKTLYLVKFLQEGKGREVNGRIFLRIRDKRNVQGKRKESGKKEKNIIMDWNAGIPPAFQSVAATRQTYVVQQGGKPPSLNSLPKFKL